MRTLSCRPITCILCSLIVTLGACTAHADTSPTSAALPTSSHPRVTARFTPTSPPITTPLPPTPTPIPVSHLPPGDYVGFTTANDAIYLLSLQDMAVIPFLRGASYPSVSPDLTKIAYLTRSDMLLHILDAETQEEVFSSPDCYSTTWAPDSRFILCDGAQLRLLPLDGTEPIEIGPCGEPPEDNYWCGPFYWSADGSFIASPRMAAPPSGLQDMRYDLLLVQLACRADAAGCTVQSNTSIPSNAVACAWISSGNQLLCRDNHGMLRLLDPPSRDWRTLLDNPCIDWTSIAASPSQPVFACNLKSDDGFDSIGIGIVSVDIGDAQLLLSDPEAIVDFWLHIP